MRSNQEASPYHEVEKQTLRAKNFAIRTQSEALEVLINEGNAAFSVAPHRINNMLLIPPEDRPSFSNRSMWSELYGPDMERFFEMQQEAARLGFVTTMIRDAGYSDNIVDEQYAFFPFTMRMSAEERQHIRKVAKVSSKRFKDLEKKGGDVINTHNALPTFIGSMFVPIMSRDHEKHTQITFPGRIKEIAWLHGWNSAQKHFEMIDLGAEFTDPRIVRPLKKEYRRFGKNKRKETAVIYCTEDTVIVVGPGKTNAAEIVNLIGYAEPGDSLYMFSAFEPVGEV